MHNLYAFIWIGCHCSAIYLLSVLKLTATYVGDFFFFLRLFLCFSPSSRRFRGLVDRAETAERLKYTKKKTFLFFSSLNIYVRWFANRPYMKQAANQLHTDSNVHRVQEEWIPRHQKKIPHIQHTNVCNNNTTTISTTREIVILLRHHNNKQYPQQYVITSIINS